MTPYVFVMAISLPLLFLAGDAELKPGDKAHLQFGDSFETTLPAAPTLAVFGKMIDQVKKDGDEALQKLLTEDAIWDVENYAAVEVVSVEPNNADAFRVKILDGAFENRTAVFPRRYVIQGPPPVEPFPENGFSFKDKRKVMAAWLRMSELESSRPEAKGKKNLGDSFLKAQDDLVKRFKLTMDELKDVMLEMVLKKVHFGKALIEENPNADHYEVARAPELVADESYSPKIGDEAYLYTASIYSKGDKKGQHTDLPICSDFFAYKEFEKVLTAKDDEGYKELEQKHRLDHVRTGTRARVLERHEFPDNGDVFIRDAYEVRIMDGPLKGKKVWVIAGDVVRLVPKAKLTPSPEAQSKPVNEAVGITPMKVNSPDRIDTAKEDAAKAAKEDAAKKARRAATLLKSAQNFEKADKPSGALIFYRQILDDFRESPQAKTAKERIKALGAR
jgi:hypothetical protein